jgi:hypothetical protein
LSQSGLGIELLSQPPNGLYADLPLIWSEASVNEKFAPTGFPAPENSAWFCIPFVVFQRLQQSIDRLKQLPYQLQKLPHGLL